MRRTGKIALYAALVATAAIAQNRLDHNTQRGAGRANPASDAGAWANVSKPIYTVSPVSNDLVYNRANAFNDPSYDIYQRYTVDSTAFRSVSTVGDQRVRSANLPTRGGTGVQPGPNRRAARPAAALARPTYGGVGSSRSVVSPSASLRASAYSTSGPRYSVRPAVRRAY